MRLGSSKPKRIKWYINEHFWGQVTSNRTLKISGCESILTVTIGIEENSEMTLVWGTDCPSKYFQVFYYPLKTDGKVVLISLVKVASRAFVMLRWADGCRKSWAVSLRCQKLFPSATSYLTTQSAFRFHRFLVSVQWVFSEGTETQRGGFDFLVEEKLRKHPVVCSQLYIICWWLLDIYLYCNIDKTAWKYFRIG